jgi:hypothetical protein
MSLEAEMFVNQNSKELGSRHWPHYIIKEKYAEVFIRFSSSSTYQDQLLLVPVEMHVPLLAPGLNVFAFRRLSLGDLSALGACL